jgi:beta-N-acetylhexosaminidase
MKKDTYKIYSESSEYSIWPIIESKFLEILYGIKDRNNKTQVFYEFVDGQLVGYISVKSKVIEKDLEGVVVFIFVTEEYRNEGIGTKLLNKAIEWFKEQGITQVKFGALAGSYFWPGVPDNLTGLKKFLRHRDFHVTKGPVDMIGKITNFNPRKNVYDSLKQNGITIEYATKEFVEKILDFTKLTFPRWHEYYATHLNAEEFEKVFFAHKGDEIIAVSELWIGDSNWELLFENNIGGGGALGVAPKWQGKGIGRAMKSWGTEILRDKGVKYVWINWTSAIEFYEKLGFKVWRTFSKAKLDLNK